MAKGSYEVAALPEVMNVCGVEIGYPLFPHASPLPPPTPPHYCCTLSIHKLPGVGANYTQRTVIMRARAEYIDV